MNICRLIYYNFKLKICIYLLKLLFNYCTFNQDNIVKIDIRTLILILILKIIFL